VERDRTKREVRLSGWKADTHYFAGENFRELANEVEKDEELDGDLRICKTIEWRYPRLSVEQQEALFTEAKLSLEWAGIDPGFREVSLFRFFVYMGEELMENIGALPTAATATAEPASGKATASGKS